MIYIHAILDELLARFVGDTSVIPLNDCDDQMEVVHHEINDVGFTEDSKGDEGQEV